MRVITRNFRTYMMAISLCVALSGIFVVANSTTTQAESLPETLVDLLTGKKDTPTDSDKAPVGSVAPSPTITPAAQQPGASSEKPAVTSTVTQNTAKANTFVVPATADAKPADTSAQIRQIATEQTTRPNVASHYASAKIAESERDDLYKASFISASIGAIIYLLSYAKPWQWLYRNAVASNKIVTE